MVPRTIFCNGCATAQATRASRDRAPVAQTLALACRSGNLHHILTANGVACLCQCALKSNSCAIEQDGENRTHFLSSFYARTCNRFSNFMNRSFILIGTMNTLPLNVRGVGLALLILAAIG